MMQYADILVNKTMQKGGRWVNPRTLVQVMIKESVSRVMMIYGDSETARQTNTQGISWEILGII